MLPLQQDQSAKRQRISPSAPPPPNRPTPLPCQRLQAYPLFQIVTILTVHHLLYPFLCLFLRVCLQPQLVTILIMRNLQLLAHGLGKSMYEREELYHWKAQHPNELPNQRPENIPFLPQNMMGDKKNRKIIDERLEDCSNFFKIGLNAART
ncbi:hypothetical protein [Neochlamydia sp. AcF65]|uniref:hypothetical protein n=1 Tax=Neochlamydia sp. AcF65 TaxID=2795735 RepID=UPI001BC8E995|nr:hypothetical protein [Neochlamydia sp. AcF65]